VTNSSTFKNPYTAIVFLSNIKRLMEAWLFACNNLFKNLRGAGELNLSINRPIRNYHMPLGYDDVRFAAHQYLLAGPST